MTYASSGDPFPRTRYNLSHDDLSLALTVIFGDRNTKNQNEAKVQRLHVSLPTT